MVKSRCSVTVEVFTWDGTIDGFTRSVRNCQAKGTHVDHYIWVIEDGQKKLRMIPDNRRG